MMPSGTSPTPGGTTEAGHQDGNLLALLAAYHAAMMDFSADALADLYTHDGVHEFGFPTPGQAPYLAGREAIRATYRHMWATPTVELLQLSSRGLHRTSRPDVLVNEWIGTARTKDSGREFTLPGVLVLQERDGYLCRVRDYMDLLTLTHHTGRLDALAASMTPGAG